MMKSTANTSTKPAGEESAAAALTCTGQGGRRGFIMSLVRFLSKLGCNNNADRRSIIHSAKVGIALVIVSLIYLLRPMFDQVGENAMWAIMTVVVMFEFYAGATLGKGINRAIGTCVGGGLGCAASVAADKVGGVGQAIVIASSLFLFGCAATYCRQMPMLKKRYDYGFMIAILTFNLVAVSGVRADKIFRVAQSRLATIAMGFAVCIFVSLAVFPFWASDQLHFSTASKFHKLATALQGCLDEYFKMGSDEKGCEEGGGGGISDHVQACKSVLNSKSNDDLLANFAKWEPWHGKFGLNYPWGNYLEIGEHLREVSVAILSLKGCLQSPKQPPAIQRQAMKDPCENFNLTVGWILKELGEGIKNMEQTPTKALITPKLQSMKLQITPQSFSPASCKMEVDKTDENLAITSFCFLLLEIVDKVEILAQKVEVLGGIANFRARRVDV